MWFDSSLGAARFLDKGSGSSSALYAVFVFPFLHGGYLGASSHLHQIGRATPHPKTGQPLITGVVCKEGRGNADVGGQGVRLLRPGCSSGVRQSTPTFPVFAILPGERGIGKESGSAGRSQSPSRFHPRTPHLRSQAGRAGDGLVGAW